MAYSVYALKLQGDSELRYIGFTGRTLMWRFWGHLKDQRGTTHKVNWIRKNPGQTEIILLCGGLPDRESAAAKEVELIAKYKKEGHRLTNSTEGGEGGRGHFVSPERRAASSARMKLSNPMHDPSVRARRRKPNTTGINNSFYGKTHTPEARLRMSQRPRTEQERANMTAAQLKRAPPTAETRAKMSKKGPLNPYYGKKHTEEAKANMRVAAKAREAKKAEARKASK